MAKPVQDIKQPEVQPTNEKIADSLGNEVATNTGQELDINLANPAQKVPGLRLNIGSGVDYKEGFINIDPYDNTADIQAEMSELPFSDNSIAQIISYETLEHLAEAELQPSLNECFRVLKKGGELILVVPDMISACERYLEDPNNDWSLARIYGNQAHDGQFHKSGFTPKKLFRLLGTAGFRTIGMAHFNEPNGVRNIYAAAEK